MRQNKKETVLENLPKRDDLEQGSQKSSKVDRDDLELIDIESLFDEDTDDRPVLSQESYRTMIYL